MPTRTPWISRNPMERVNGVSEGTMGPIVRDVVLPNLTEPCPQSEGTGVVMAAGGARYLKYAFASVRQLREQSNWPVQIWHLGPAELTQQQRDRFSGLDVEFVDAKPVFHKEHFRYRHPWNVKVLAVCYSPFRHTLLLDADCAPMLSPERAFETPEYEETGAMFFLDGKTCRRGDGIGPCLGLRHPVPEMESGQLLVDKARHWRPLQLAKWLNQWKLVYDLEHGDKNVYSLAFAKLGVPFSASPPPTWSGYGYTHYLPDGTPAFDHALAHKRSSVQIPDRLTELWAEFDKIGTPHSQLVTA